MSMTSAAIQSVGASRLHRARFLIAMGALWAGLHFLVEVPLLPRGLDRPLTLSPPAGSYLAAVPLVAVLWAGAWLTTVLARPARVRDVLMVLAGSLVLWAAEGGRTGGTMTSWLKLVNVWPGPPRAAPYPPLLVDYAVLLVGVLGAAVIAAWSGSSGVRSWMHAVRATLGLDMPPASRRAGLLHLLTIVVVATVVMAVLLWPAAAETYRWQVYFATAAGLAAGSYAARRVSPTDRVVWAWLAPFILGVIGLLVATVSPGLALSEGYRELNIKPAWSLARPMPIEMIGAGTLAVLWLFRPAPDQREHG